MADRRRCTVFNNANPQEGKAMLVPANATLDSVLRQASEKLGVHGKMLFLEDGGQIDDVNLIRDNDSIFVSCGEPFNGPKAGNNKQKQTNLPLYSIAVMGPGSVGKSAITLQYVQGVFVIDYDPTIEDAYRKPTTVDGHSCQLDILDTAGQEDYIALRSTWMRERDGFILVFSVTDRTSFETLHEFYNQLCVMHEDNLPPILIAGNKADLVDQRKVSTEEGRKLAEEFKAVGYYETSAKTGQNVDKSFAALIRDMRKREPAPPRDVKPTGKRWCRLF